MNASRHSKSLLNPSSFNNCPNAPWLYAEERQVLYSILHPFERAHHATGATSHFPNHDEFLLASFLAACYNIPLAISSILSTTPSHPSSPPYTNTAPYTARPAHSISPNTTTEIATHPLLLTIPISPTYPPDQHLSSLHIHIPKTH